MIYSHINRDTPSVYNEISCHALAVLLHSYYNKETFYQTFTKYLLSFFFFFTNDWTKLKLCILKVYYRGIKYIMIDMKIHMKALRFEIHCFQTTIQM